MKRILDRKAWGTPLLLALLCVVFFRHVLLPEPGFGALTGDDLRNIFYPVLTFVVQSLRAGEYPLWNPHLFAGTPAIIDPQSGLYYPPNVLLLLFGVQRGVTLSLVLHVWWGAWGMARLARSFDASPLGGLLAGTVFGFSSFMMANLWAGHYTLVSVAAWGPWVLTGYCHALQRGTWRSALPGGAMLGLALLAGHPPLLLYVAVMLVALGASHLVETHVDGQPLRPAVWLVARQLFIIVAASALLSAVLLLPTAIYVPHTQRSQMGLDFVGSYALPGVQLLTIIVPDLLGSPTSDPGYWGGANFVELSGGFVGLWPLFAGLLALRLRKRPAYFYWALALLGMLLSIGLRGGLLIIAARWLPLFGLFRAPGRALYLTVIALAGLSAQVVTHLQGVTSAERRHLLRPALRVWLPGSILMLFGTALALLVVWSLALPGSDNQRLWAMGNAVAETGLLAGAVAFSLWLWREEGRRAVAWASLLTVIVVVVDLWRFGLPLVTVDKVEPFFSVWHQINGAVPSGDPSFRLITDYATSWEANGSMVTGHYNVTGFGPDEADTFARLRDASHDPAANNNRLLGVRYLVLRGPYEDKGFDLAANPTLIDEGPDTIYEIEGSLRAFLPAEYEIIPDDEAALARLMEDDFDPSRTVILDREPGCSVGGSGGATFTGHALNHTTLSVQSDGPGLLVLTDQWYPDWMARVDGQPARILRADVTFRAVCVPAGQHTVSFRFRPVPWYAGAVLSVLSWAGLLVTGLLSFKPASLRGRHH